MLTLDSLELFFPYEVVTDTDGPILSQVLRRDRPLVLTIKRPSDTIAARVKQGLNPLVTAEEIAAKRHISNVLLGKAGVQKDMELAAGALEDGEVFFFFFSLSPPWWRQGAHGLFMQTGTKL